MNIINMFLAILFFLSSKDHLYALPSSPSDLTARLNQVLARVECLEREKRNAKDRERRAKSRMFCLLEYLEEKKLLNDEMRERLDSNLGMNFQVFCRNLSVRVN